MLIAKSGKELHLLPEMSNRHGLIAGSSGSGKTITLRVMAENFSKIGVPVFMADVKGDLTGLEAPGELTQEVRERISKMDLGSFSFEGFPTRYWDVFGEEGDELKVSLQKLTPLLISRLLNLSEVQNESLAQIFKIAQSYSGEGNIINIDTIRDMASIVNTIIDNATYLEPQFGKISKPSLASIQRSLLMLEQGGEDVLFSKDSFDVTRFLQTESNYGVINIFKARKLYDNPTIYATFLLWMVAELYRALPECGDIEKPRIVFFFDEAHLLFDDAPKVLIDNIEKLVRLIRSKGVGVFFITQNPSDVSDKVLGQLGNRVQHSLRAYTPKEQKSIKVIAQTFRNTTTLNVEQAIQNLKIGEALISFLDETGAPSPVQKAFVCPPKSMVGGQSFVADAENAPASTADLLGSLI